MLSSVLRALFGRRPPPLNAGGETALLNYSLELAQEWGDQWLKPIQDRLRKAYPSLSQSELDRFNSEAQAAMNYGHQLVYSMVEKNGRDISESLWRETYLARYSWVDEKNLRHLFSTGQYYAWKDFG